MKNNKLAIVTGGSSGIGLAVCRYLSNIYPVISADIDSPPGEISGEITHVSCDISNGADIEKLSGKIMETGLQPEVLVLNAGKGIHEKIREGDPEKWMEVIQTNIGGTLRTLRAVLPFMKSGNIIFISSVSAGKAYPYGGIYAASKTAIEILAETLRLEEQPDINVTVISPGVVDTAFFDNMLAGNHSIEDIGYGSIPPEEIAEALEYTLKRKKSVAVNKIILRPSDQIL